MPAVLFNYPCVTVFIQSTGALFYLFKLDKVMSCKIWKRALHTENVAMFMFIKYLRIVVDLL